MTEAQGSRWPCPRCGELVVKETHAQRLRPGCPACGCVSALCGVCGGRFTLDEVFDHIRTSDCRFPRAQFLMFKDGDKRVDAGLA